MLKGTRLVCKVRRDFIPRDPPTTRENENKSESLSIYNLNKGMKVSYPHDMPNGFKFMESPNCFFRRRFLSGASNCRNISFVKSGGDNFQVSQESIDDLMRMLKFKSEPCYQRPYRLIADSKLCLKGNCDTVSSILRPGW